MQKKFQNFWPHRFKVWRKRKIFSCTVPTTRSSNFYSCWHQKLELHKVEVFEIHNGGECEVVVEKIWEVGEGCSIVKTFFVMEQVQNSGIALALLLYYYSPKIPIKWKSKRWAQRVLLGLEIQNIRKEKTKISKNMLKWWKFMKKLEGGGGNQRRGWYMNPIHAPNFAKWRGLL